MSKTSARYTWVADAVPQNVMNRIDWANRYGTIAACPKRIGRVPCTCPCVDDSAQAPNEIAGRAAIVAALKRIAISPYGSRSAPRP